MNYYQRHLGDYAKDTGWLSTYQHGVYALLLDWYYSNEKPIPVDLAYRIVKARSGPERAAIQEVLLAFFDLNKCAGFAHHKRADIDLAKYQAKSAANSLIAKTAWDAKRMPDASQTHSERDASHKPVTNSHKEQEQAAPRKPKSKAPEQTLDGWISSLDGGDAVSAADPVFEWAGKQGIPGEWIGYAWAAFEDRYAGKDKTQADWRAAFRTHVKRGWLDIWRLDARTGNFVLTTAGEQYRREVQA